MVSENSLTFLHKCIPTHDKNNLCKFHDTSAYRSLLFKFSTLLINKLYKFDKLFWEIVSYHRIINQYKKIHHYKCAQMLDKFTIPSHEVSTWQIYCKIHWKDGEITQKNREMKRRRFRNVPEQIALKIAQGIAAIWSQPGIPEDTSLAR